MIEKCEGLDNIEEYMQGLCHNGAFNTSKAYDTLRTRNPIKPWMKCIWQAYIPPRFSFTTWLALRRCLPTKVNLPFVEMETKNNSLCHMELETSEHLFFSFHISSHVWNGIKQWLNIDASLSTIKRAIKWLRRQHTGHNNRKKFCRLGTMSVIYHIWKMRNIV
ncbi:unnamed protein product [Cuscuta campestris]|uniref:Reverse transcriptase zinc-binding domain-containing protein n=1 Tax=Cuscuta campestris TaxID=132261 RepID=A0A484M9W0_9ASTE|nr:unnamed protein product [Cuscuta campestris]